MSPPSSCDCYPQLPGIYGQCEEYSPHDTVLWLHEFSYSISPVPMSMNEGYGELHDQAADHYSNSNITSDAYMTNPSMYHDYDYAPALADGTVPYDLTQDYYSPEVLGSPSSTYSGESAELEDSIGNSVDPTTLYGSNMHRDIPDIDNTYYYQYDENNNGQYPSLFSQPYQHGVYDEEGDLLLKQPQSQLHYDSVSQYDIYDGGNHYFLKQPQSQLYYSSMYHPEFTGDLTCHAVQQGHVYAHDNIMDASTNGITHAATESFIHFNDSDFSDQSSSPSSQLSEICLPANDDNYYYSQNEDPVPFTDAISEP